MSAAIRSFNIVRSRTALALSDGYYAHTLGPPSHSLSRTRRLHIRVLAPHRNVPTDIEQIHIHWSADDSCEAYGDGHYGRVIRMHLQGRSKYSLVIARWVAGAVGQGMSNAGADWWWPIFSLLIPAVAIVPTIIVAVLSEVIRLLVSGATVAKHIEDGLE